MAKSLLPFNSTPLERGIELAFADRLDSIPHLIRTTANADTIPSELLPWLAWARRVEVWNSNWPDEHKRNAIKASFAVHRKAGTVAAIKQALGALGVDVQLREWWQDKQNRDPYTFWNVIDPGDNPLTREFWFELLDIVDRTKNVRSHMGVNEVIRRVPFEECIGAKTILHEVVSLPPFREASTFLAGMAFPKAQYDIQAAPVPNDNIAAASLYGFNVRIGPPSIVNIFTMAETSGYLLSGDFRVSAAPVPNDNIAGVTKTHMHVLVGWPVINGQSSSSVAATTGYGGQVITGWPVIEEKVSIHDAAALHLKHDVTLPPGDKFLDSNDVSGSTTIFFEKVLVNHSGDY